MARQKCNDCGNRVTLKNIEKYPNGWYCHNCRAVTKVKFSVYKEKEPKKQKKVCFRCKKFMLLKEFGIAHNRINSWCKQCFREYNKEQRALESYKERRKLYMREYRKRKH